MPISRRVLPLDPFCRFRRDFNYPEDTFDRILVSERVYHFVKPERILLPLDIYKCPVEIFSLVNRLTGQMRAKLVLLHVINPKNNSQRGHVQELEQQARECLTRLIEENVRRGTVAIPHVRIGQAADQILEEAAQEKVDLIVLPTFGPSWWSKLWLLCAPRTRRVVSFLAERIIREASCGVFLAAVNTRSNCAKRWVQQAQRSEKVPSTNTVLLRSSS